MLLKKLRTLFTVKLNSITYPLMTDLSPTAQALKDAVLTQYVDFARYHAWELECSSVVSVLQFISGQILMPEDRPSRGMRPGGTVLLNDSEVRVDERQNIRRQLLELANELEESMPHPLQSQSLPPQASQSFVPAPSSGT